MTLLFDQGPNGIEAEHQGIGLHLPFSKLNEKDLLEKIQAVASEKKYQERVKELNAQLLDQMEK